MSSSQISIPILLTSSVIVHDTGVALTNQDERVRLTLESVHEWLKIDTNLRIVLCDGSGFNFTTTVRAQFPEAHIECLYFDNDVQQVRQHGRGYGEGEIVRYALAHSRLISEAGCFGKCSSKLWIKNFSECLGNWDGKLLLKGVFSDVFSPFRPTSFAYIDTRFYMASVDIYRQYFVDAHTQIQKERGHGLEECFRDVVIQKQLKHILFRSVPIVCGVGGGTGIYYRNPVKRRLKEKIRLALVRNSSTHRHLFS